MKVYITISSTSALYKIRQKIVSRQVNPITAAMQQISAPAVHMSNGAAIQLTQGTTSI